MVDCGVVVHDAMAFYHVQWGDKTDYIEDYYLGGERRGSEGWNAWLVSRLEGIVRAWCVTYPREVWKMVENSKFQNRESAEDE